MRFAPIFQDHAVLQRDMAIPVWGIADGNERVTVSLAGHSIGVPAESDGRWIVRLPALTAGGPYELTAESPSGKVTIHDVLIGDVWVCSGQSNMEWPVGSVTTLDQSDLLKDLPKIRLLTVANPAHQGDRQEEIIGSWTLANPKTLRNFSAVGAWFGRELHLELGVPIGLICTAWGGTPILPWISREALMQDPHGEGEVLRYERTLYSTTPETKLLSFEEWERKGAPQDTGNSGLTQGWANPKFHDDAWPTMPVPSRWQDNGHPGSGIFWFRHSVDIPADWAGQDLELHLGAVDKHDDTWVNGERVGGLSWEAGPLSWRTPRVYPVPRHLVGSDGRLAIAVRARSHVYQGGLIGPASEMYVVPAGAPESAGISLAGDWRYVIEQNWGLVELPVNLSGQTPTAPFVLFDSRVKPLLPYAIRGATWYQGESNASEARLYQRLLPLMIRDWRRAWGQGNFPFLIVQLANFGASVPEPKPSAWAELREAQLAALSVPNTGLAVAVDIGDALDIHPPDKRSVGGRLARWALAEVHGRGGIPSGPLYTRSVLEAEGRVRIHFRYAAGLATRDGKSPGHVAIAGRDKAYKWAHSRIEDETLVVWHPEIQQPASVRYAWADNPEGSNLVNGEKLPASPFRTDDWVA